MTIPLWLAVCLAFAAVGAVLIARVKLESGGYVPDLGGILVKFLILVATVICILLTLVVKGCYGW